MARDHGITAGGVAIAFLAGAAVGAAVALLFAPATGEQTRDFLGQRARDGRDKANEAARQGRDIFNKQRDNLTTAFERAREQQRSGSLHTEEQDA